MADTGFVIPTLQTIIDRVKGDLNSRMGTNASFIRRSLAYVLAYVLAGAVWGLYLYQRYISNQVIPDRAEAGYLERWCRIFGITRLSATKASGTVVTTAAAGATVADDEVLQRGDGVEYIVIDGPYTWTVSGTQDVSVEAVEAGDDGNYDYILGASLEYVSPSAGVVASAPLKTSTDITGGSDEESDADLLARLLTRIQTPPQGGAESDYIAWAQAADASVDRVWVQAFPDRALGDVYVYFTVYGTGSNVIPGAGTVSTVQTYIDGVCPVTAQVTVAAPIEHSVTLRINLTTLDGYTVADVRADIVSELQGMFRDAAEVSVSGDIIENSRISEAIGSVNGVDYFVLEAVDGGGALSDIDLSANEYPTIESSSITWS